MGDLKKKKITDYMIDVDDDNNILVKKLNESGEEEIIEKLRSYILKFYDIQEEKLKKEEKDVENGGEWALWLGTEPTKTES